MRDFLKEKDDSIACDAMRDFFPWRREVLSIAKEVAEDEVSVKLKACGELAPVASKRANRDATYRDIVYINLY